MALAGAASFPGGQVTVVLAFAIIIKLHRSARRIGAGAALLLALPVYRRRFAISVARGWIES